MSKLNGTMRAKRDKIRAWHAANAKPSDAPASNRAALRAQAEAAFAAFKGTQGVVTVGEVGKYNNTWRKRGGSTLGQLDRKQEIVYGSARAAPAMRAVVERQTWAEYGKRHAGRWELVRR